MPWKAIKLTSLIPVMVHYQYLELFIPLLVVTCFERVGFAKFWNYESSPSASRSRPPCINHLTASCRNSTRTRTRTSAAHWLPPTQRLNPPQDRCREIFRRPWKSPNLQGTQIVHPFARHLPAPIPKVVLPNANPSCVAADISNGCPAP